MNFSSIFGSRKPATQPLTTSDSLAQHLSATSDSLAGSEAIRTYPRLSEPIRGEINSVETWFLPTQLAWLHDDWHLRIWEKSRQVGATKTDAFDSVMKVAFAGARFDVWVTSRDEFQARLYLEDCLEWAKILHLAAVDLGLVILDTKNHFTAHTLQFANGRRIYCLSSNPNALAGKRGHVKIDEFALHSDQRQLYRIAKPVTQWGGTFSIISTHGNRDTQFNQFIRDIREAGNPMRWHLFSYPIQKAVEEGIVERINLKSGRNESREAFLKRTHDECVDEEQWLREYCCTPADESSAFFSYELLSACEDHHLKLLSLDELTDSSSSSFSSSSSTLYVGVDVARKNHLCVIDVGEKLGNITWDRARIELQNQPFSVIADTLYRILRLRAVKRCCIDATGMGMQLAEEAKYNFGSKVEPVTFTAAVKENLAFTLHRDFEERKLRIVADPKLRTDLRGLKKEVTIAGNIRFIGETEDSHCDRTWAMALRQHAARYRRPVGGFVV